MMLIVPGGFDAGEILRPLVLTEVVERRQLTTGGFKNLAVSSIS